MCLHIQKNKKLKNWENYKTTSSLKPHLIKHLGNICECCKLSKWLDQEIKLEIHHIDGDRTNNSFENLQLLCPNCHTQTDNFCKRDGCSEFSPKSSDKFYEQMIWFSENPDLELAESNSGRKRIEEKKQKEFILLKEIK